MYENAQTAQNARFDTNRTNGKLRLSGIAANARIGMKRPSIWDQPLSAAEPPPRSSVVLAFYKRSAPTEPRRFSPRRGHMNVAQGEAASAASVGKRPQNNSWSSVRSDRGICRRPSRLRGDGGPLTPHSARLHVGLNSAASYAGSGKCRRPSRLRGIVFCPDPPHLDAVAIQIHQATNASWRPFGGGLPHCSAVTARGHSPEDVLGSQFLSSANRRQESFCEP